MSEVREVIEELVAEKMNLAAVLRRIADECGSSEGGPDAMAFRCYWVWLVASSALGLHHGMSDPGPFDAWRANWVAANGGPKS